MRVKETSLVAQRHEAIDHMRARHKGARARQRVGGTEHEGVWPRLARGPRSGRRLVACRDRDRSGAGVALLATSDGLVDGPLAVRLCAVPLVPFLPEEAAAPKEP